jgi:hypothetical protein
MGRGVGRTGCRLPSQRQQCVDGLRELRAPGRRADQSRRRRRPPLARLTSTSSTLDVDLMDPTSQYDAAPSWPPIDDASHPAAGGASSAILPPAGLGRCAPYLRKPRPRLTRLARPNPCLVPSIATRRRSARPVLAEDEQRHEQQAGAAMVDPSLDPVMEDHLRQLRHDLAVESRACLSLAAHVPMGWRVNP